MNLPVDFYQKVEDANYLNYVLYSDTDSIYILIPINIKNKTTEEKIDLAGQTAKIINDRITEYNNNIFFKRSNVNIKHNFINFKTELILDSIMFIPNVKKQYAYKKIAEGSKIYNPPIVDYKGIQVVKIDAAILNKKMLVQLIEDVMLNSEIEKSKKKEYVAQLVQLIFEQFKASCEELDIENFGISCKWGKDQSIINSMLIYNFIIDKKIFMPLSSGYFIYCNFKPKTVIKLKSLGIEFKDMKAISIPYGYNKELLKKKLEEFEITIDEKQQWGRIYTTTCQRIIDMVKGL